MKSIAQACILALGVSAIKIENADDESMAQVDAYGGSAYGYSAYDDWYA